MTERYFHRAALLQRGWTKPLIADVLGKPDRVVTNPHHNSGKMYLFEPSRVQEAESVPAVAVQLLRRKRNVTTM